MEPIIYSGKKIVPPGNETEKPEDHRKVQAVLQKEQHSGQYRQQDVGRIFKVQEDRYLRLKSKTSENVYDISEVVFIVYAFYFT